MSAPAGTAIFDLDGVVYLGGTGIAGAGQALHTLRDSGWHLLFATNNASATAVSVAEKITRLTGFTPSESAVVTCAMAAASYLRGSTAPVFVVGEPALRSTLADGGLSVTEEPEDAEAVVVGIDFSFTYDRMKDATAAIRSGATFIATNTDATYPTPRGLAPGAGSIVAAVRTASGQAPIVVGKPEQPMIDLLAERIEGEAVWVVGDRPETDIAMAQRAGWRSILPLTGVIGSAAELTGPDIPEVVVDSIVHVPDIIL